MSCVIKKLFINILSFFIISTILISDIESKKLPCQKWKSIVLDHRVPNEHGQIESNGIIFEISETFETDKLLQNGEKEMRGCPCIRHSCVRKCCLGSQIYSTVNGTSGITTKCVDDPHTTSLFDELDFYSQDYGSEPEKLSHQGMMAPTFVYEELKPYCSKKKVYALDNEDFYLLNNGSLLKKLINGDVPYGLLTIDDYCVEKMNDRIQFLACANVKSSGKTLRPLEFGDNSRKLNIFSICIITSLPFLTVTCLLFCFIPELNNLVGKSLSNLTFTRLLYTLPLLLIYHYAPELRENWPLLCNFIACISMGPLIGLILFPELLSAKNKKLNP